MHEISGLWYDNTMMENGEKERRQVLIPAPAGMIHMLRIRIIKAISFDQDHFLSSPHRRP